MLRWRFMHWLFQKLAKLDDFIHAHWNGTEDGESFLDVWAFNFCQFSQLTLFSLEECVGMFDFTPSMRCEFVFDEELWDTVFSVEEGHFIPRSDGRYDGNINRS